MKKRSFLSLAFALICLCLNAQDYDTIPKGIHQVQSEYYSSFVDSVPAGDEISTELPVRLKSTAGSALTHMVYGWHPYWASANAYQSYDYNSLSHIAYFSYEVDTATGGYSNLRGWNTTPVISYAHSRGVKVTLTVTNFGTARNTAILSDTVKQINLITNLITQLKSRQGDGINFDFETVPVSQKANLVSFCSRAVRMIKAEIPEAEISLATPAVDWSGAWDYNALADICDYLIIMGYNYYWGGSSTAGPVAPLTGETQNVTKSIDTYLAAGVPTGKLLLGVPWYGYDWPVVSADRKAETTGTGSSRIYTAAEQLAALYGKELDDITKVPWLSYYESSTWRQLWYDDSLSLSLKNDLVKSKNLAGIGIWALSYDGGQSEIWGSIKAAYSTEPPEYCSIISIVPNPVVTTTKIRFSLPETGHVTLRIIDLSGATREVLINRTMDAGYYEEPFNANGYSQGIYICALHTSSGKSIMKFLILN